MSLIKANNKHRCDHESQYSSLFVARFVQVSRSLRLVPCGSRGCKTRIATAYCLSNMAEVGNVSRVRLFNKTRCEGYPQAPVPPSITPEVSPAMVRPLTGAFTYELRRSLLHVCSTRQPREPVCERHDLKRKISDVDADFDVGNDLLKHLEMEVTRVRLPILGKSLGVDSAFLQPCPMCPCRVLRNVMDLQLHIDKQHTSRNNFVCSGNKQMRAIIAMYDMDQLHGRLPGTYLQRSVGWMRSPIGQGI